MIALLLLQAGVQSPPPPQAPPATITRPVPAVAWECDLTGPWQTKIVGKFGAVDASVKKPVADPKPLLFVTSDPDGLLSGEIQRRGYYPGIYFFQFWTGRQVRPFTFEFRNLSSGTGTVKYWAGSNGLGVCKIRELAGERG